MNKTEEIKKHIMLINDILLKEEKEKQNNMGKVRMVYWLDETWILDRSTIKLFSDWADAYTYYRELGKDIVQAYVKNNERLKKPITISDFTETTHYSNGEYPEFWINNRRDWECRIFFEYEEAFLEEIFITQTWNNQKFMGTIFH